MEDALKVLHAHLELHANYRQVFETLRQLASLLDEVKPHCKFANDYVEENSAQATLTLPNVLQYLTQHRELLNQGRTLVGMCVDRVYPLLQRIKAGCGLAETEGDLTMLATDEGGLAPGANLASVLAVFTQCDDELARYRQVACTLLELSDIVIGLDAQTRVQCENVRKPECVTLNFDAVMRFLRNFEKEFRTTQLLIDKVADQLFTPIQTLDKLCGYIHIDV